MALTIEDGSIVANAESFATVAELRAYAAKRSATVPQTDPPCEILLVKAMDFIQAQEQRFMGSRVRREQALSWPRYGVVVNDFYVLPDMIPLDIKRAQMQLAIEAQTVDLMPTLDASKQKGPLVRQKVDVLEVEYGAPAINRSSTLFAKADGLLAKFFSYGANQVKFVRG